jgi:D-inositol-3-phosphate glycosyltransferase
MGKESSDKIILISTAFPYRGGIAATTDRLAQEYASRDTSVEIWTYKLLYPKIIFPGKSQYHDLEKHAAPENIIIKRKISSINPFNWLKVGRELKKSRPTKVIIRYWLPILAPCLGTISRLAKKNKTSKIIALVDNVIPHEKRFGDKMLSSYFYKQVDGFIVMAEKGIKDLKTIFQIRQPIIYTPHPIFDNYGHPVSKEEAAKQLQLPAENQYILSFGLIRKYKGVDLLLEAFARFSKEHPQHRLLIVGESYDDWGQYAEIIQKHALTEQVIRIDKFVNDEEVKYYFSIADYLALTYRSATQSGVTQIAYMMELPVLVTDVGDLANTIPHQKAGLVVQPNIASITKGLNEMAQSKNLLHFRKGMRDEKHRFEWATLCDKLDQL